MGLLEHECDLIQLPVNDRVIGDGIFKQEVWIERLHHWQTREGSCFVEMTGWVYLFESNNGEKGEEVNRKGITRYDVTLTAKDDTIVSFPDGKILAVQGRKLREASESAEAEWEEAATGEAPTMLQGKWFHWIRKNAGKNGVPGINIEELMVGNALAAIELGHYQ